MEYLMTYGWALLVIVIVGAALFALCILNPATYQQKRCNGLQYFTYIDQAASTTNYTIHARNGVNDINITQIEVAGTAVDVSNVSLARMTADGIAYDPNSGNWINQGFEFTIDAGGLSLTAGAYDDLAVVITYNVKNGISGNSDTGTCIGTVV